MLRLLAFCAALMLGIGAAFAGPAEEAASVVDQWSGLYNAGNRDALVGLYAPDAVFFGTNAAAAIRGREGIGSYFTVLGQGNRRNRIVEKNAVALSDAAAMVTGFYDFSRSDDSAPPQPARFTMVLVKRDGSWLILHHHSSPRGRVGQ